MRGNPDNLRTRRRQKEHRRPRQRRARTARDASPRRADHLPRPGRHRRRLARLPLPQHRHSPPRRAAPHGQARPRGTRRAQQPASIVRTLTAQLAELKRRHRDEIRAEPGTGRPTARTSNCAAASPPAARPNPANEQRRSRQRPARHDPPTRRQIPLTPAWAAAIRRALAALGAIPAGRRNSASASTSSSATHALRAPPGSRSQPASDTRTARPPSSATRLTPGPSRPRHGRVRDGSDLRKFDENLSELQITPGLGVPDRGDRVAGQGGEGRQPGSGGSSPPTRYPRPTSSPWMRRYPQRGFSRVNCSTRARTSSGTGGRPAAFG